LIRNKTLGPIQGFRSKTGRPFAAVLRLADDGKIEFDFGQNGENEGGPEIDFSGQEPLGRCPKCGGNVFEAPMAYLCERATGASRACDFRSGKIILQRAIEREQMSKLLATGKTDLLQKFISKKGRPFSAYLVLGKDGKVGFEFEPRKPRAAKKKTARKEEGESEGGATSEG
jgi:DNA topoisomerase III